MGPIRLPESMALRALAAGAVMALGATGCAEGSNPEISAQDPSTTTEATTSTTTTTEAEKCADSWEMTQLDNTGRRVVAAGVDSLGEAETEEEARDALADWTELITSDPEVFSGALVELNGSLVAPETLVDANGCATPEAEVHRTQLELKFAAAEVSPTVDIDPNATNTGVAEDGTLVAADGPGITGDRRGIEVTFAEDGLTGEKYGFMRRCGNIALYRMPRIPFGPTDEPENPFGPKWDRNFTPAGVPNQNGGDSTSPGSRVGEGPAIVRRFPDGFDRPIGEYVPADPVEQIVPADPNSNTEAPSTDGGGLIGPEQGGTDTPAAPPVEVPVEGGQGGNTGEGNV